eukprot:m.220974 g.220974  ORF g.220974 m.220974 type:complete len:77 (+) comp15605_c0_seq8:129-359(+)
MPTMWMQPPQAHYCINPLRWFELWVVSARICVQLWLRWSAPDRYFRQSLSNGVDCCHDGTVSCTTDVEVFPGLVGN